MMSLLLQVSQQITKRDEKEKEKENESNNTGIKFIFLAGLFLSMLVTKEIEIGNCSLIVFDEAHNAVGKSVYVKVMEYFEQCRVQFRPKVLFSILLLLYYYGIDNMIIDSRPFCLAGQRKGYSN